MSNKDKVLVGQFSSPIGLRGELKVNIMTTTFDVFKKLQNYTNFDGTVIWKFKKITLKGKKCIVQLDNCLSKEDANKFKGEKIFSDKKNLPAAKENEYFINDLIGCKINIKHKSIYGEVINVKNFGAGDLLEVKVEKKIILIPFNKENIISVTLSKKEINVDPIDGILN